MNTTPMQMYLANGLLQKNYGLISTTRMSTPCEQK
jgi:hypothetical protein